MKKIKLFTVLMLCFASVGLTTSCSKDDDKNYSELIVGKWRQTNTDDEKSSNVWEFTEDGYYFRNGNKKAKYSVKGDQILMYWKAEDGSFTDDDNDWNKYTILSLNSSRMTIYHWVEKEGGYDPSTGEYLDYEYTYEFERI